MTSPLNTNSGLKYRVGDLHVDLGTASVRRGDELLRVQGLSFDLLVLLIRAAPNVVTHEELLAQVWKGLVVSPETLSQRIKLLRSALSDDSRAPRYIEVVRGRGCRLAAEVSLLSPSPEPAAGIARPDPPTARTAGLPMVLGVTALVALAALAAWRVVPVVGDIGQAQQTLAQIPRSVAVLPFQTGTDDPQQRAFALGIAETLRHQLAASRDLLVIAGESSFGPRVAAPQDLRATGLQLRAALLITGVVQQQGDALRITTHLIEAASGRELWSQQFDRPRKDLFELQDEIASEVAAALQLSVEQRQRISSPGSGTRDLAAWLAYQRGQALMLTRRKSDLVAAEQAFEQARKHDPRFGAAHTAQAEARMLIAMSSQSEFWGSLRPVMTEVDRATTLQLVATALQIDPQSGEAYSARAWMQTDRELAMADARRSVDLAPNDVTAIRRLAQIVYDRRREVPRETVGNAALESLRLLQRAEMLDPLSAPTQMLLARGWLYSFSDHGKALAIAERLTKEHPDFHPGWVQLGEVLWCCRGEFARAIVALEHARKLDPQAQWTRDFLARAYLDIGDSNAARAVLTDPEYSLPEADPGLLMKEGRFKEAAESGIASATLQTTGLRATLIRNAVHGWLAVGTLDADRAKRLAELHKGYSAASQPPWASLLGAHLLKSGDKVRGRQLLRDAIDQMNLIASGQGRGYLFMDRDLVLAYASLGDYDAALQAMQRSISLGRISDAWLWSVNPVLKPLAQRPEFRQLVREVAARAQAELQEVQRLRKAGVLPIYPQAG